MLFPHKPDPPDLALKGGTLHFVFSRWHGRSMSEKRLELVRGLGPWASAAIVVGTTIGTGIFLKPAEMAREGRYVSLVFGAWIVGAVLSVFGALSYAELGSPFRKRAASMHISAADLALFGASSSAGCTPS